MLREGVVRCYSAVRMGMGTGRAVRAGRREQRDGSAVESRIRAAQSRWSVADVLCRAVWCSGPGWVPGVVLVLVLVLSRRCWGRAGGVN